MFSNIMITTILLIVCYESNTFCFGFSFITNNNYHVSSSSSLTRQQQQQQQERVFTSDDVFLRCRNQHGIVESSNNNNGLLGSTSTRLSAETSKEANGETQDSSSTTSATTTTTEVPSSLTETNSEEEEVDDEEEEDEWEYEEYTMLTEEDFYGSEWKTGTVWNNNKSNKVDETWVRLITKDSKLIAYWGDGAEGKWSFDTSTQFFSVSKESFGGWNGKKIWAGTIDDYYYMSGTVRGWSVLLPASVLGQWQFKRLGVTDEERGVAPWFKTNNQQDDDEEEEVKEETDE